MNNPIIEKMVQAVFEKAKNESGGKSRNALVHYIHDEIERILEDEKKNSIKNSTNKFMNSQIISVKTLERYHRVYIDKKEYVEGFSPPGEHFRYQLSRFLGFEDYSDYMKKYYREENQGDSINMAEKIIQIETQYGDIHNH